MAISAASDGLRIRVSVDAHRIAPRMGLSTLDLWSSRHLPADALSAAKYGDGLDVELLLSSP